MAKAKASVIVTEGAPGSGKSFARCAGFIPEFLHQVRPTEEAPCWHISNFPVALDDRFDDNGQLIKGMVTHCREKYGLDEEEVRERVVVIDQETMEAWKSFTTGPWDTFAETNLAGCHLAIDEAHFVIPHIGCNAKHRKRWADWLSMIRHRGCSVELLTQDEKSIAGEVLLKVGMKVSLFNTENTRDPFFRILLGDWFELLCGLTPLKIPSVVHESERVRQEGRWTVTNRKAWMLTPELFGLYDSYNKPEGGGKAGRTIDAAHKRFKWYGLIWWFCVRNWWSLSTRLSLAAFLVLFIIFGGPRAVSAHYFKVWEEIGASVMQKRDAKTGKGPKPAAAPGAAPVITTASRDYVAELPADVQATITPAVRLELDALYLQVEQLTASLAHAKEGQGRAEEQLEALEDKVRRAFEVVAVGRDWVTFREGYTYAIGERIDWGPYEGDALKAIDWEHRLCVMESGNRLRMPTTVERALPGRIGDGVQAVAALVPREQATPATNVSGTLRTPGSDGADEGHDAARAAPGHDQRPTNATGPVLPLAQQRGGRINRGGATARLPTPDGGRGRSNGERNLERGSATPGRGSNSSGSPVLRGPAETRR